MRESESRDRTRPKSQGVADAPGPGYDTLHRLEQMRERAADVEFFGTRLQRDQRLIAVVALHASDRAQIDDRSAMHLPELLAVQLVEELLDRLADERVAVTGNDLGVLVLGVEVDDLVDRNQAHRRSERCADPAQRPTPLASVQLRQHGSEIR